MCFGNYFFLYVLSVLFNNLIVSADLLNHAIELYATLKIMSVLYDITTKTTTKMTITKTQTFSRVD